MSFIVCLAKKENNICVSITLREVVMIAAKWLVSRWGGRDKEDERSTRAIPQQIIGVFVCVCSPQGDEGRWRWSCWLTVYQWVSCFMCLNLTAVTVLIEYVTVFVSHSFFLSVILSLFTYTYKPTFASFLFDFLNVPTALLLSLLLFPHHFSQASLSETLTFFFPLYL